MLNPIKKIAECINKFRSEKERKQKYQSLMTDLNEAFDQLKSLIKDSPERIEFSVFNGWLDTFIETFNQAQNISKPEDDHYRHCFYLNVIDYLTVFLEEYFSIRLEIYKDMPNSEDVKATYQENCRRYENAVREAAKCLGESFFYDHHIFVDGKNPRSVLNCCDDCKVEDTIQRNYNEDGSVEDIRIEEGKPIPKYHYRYNDNLENIIRHWVKVHLVFLWDYQKKSS